MDNIISKRDILSQVIEVISEYINDVNVESIKIEECKKNNGVIMQGLNFKIAGSNVSPCVYPDNYLPYPLTDECIRKNSANYGFDEYYDEDKICINDIARSMANEFVKAVEVAEEIGEKFENLITDNFDDVKDDVYLMLVNYNDNLEKLSSCPHKVINDLAVVYRVSTSDSSSFYSTIIDNRIIEKWNIDLDELDATARGNSEKKLPSVFFKVDSYLRKVAKERCIYDEVPDCPLYVLSNSENVFGASVILYENMLEKVYSELNENFYLLPSSINEFLVLTDSYCSKNSDQGVFERENDWLKSMVREVNDYHIPVTQMLSYSVYYYNHEAKSLQII